MKLKRKRLYYNLVVIFFIAIIVGCKDNKDPIASIPNPTLNWSKATDIFGGSINALAASGRDLYAGTDKGLFLSNDNGSTWKTVSLGTVPDEVTVVTIADNLIFVGTTTYGLFVSNDYGTTWSRGQGLAAGRINAISISGSYGFVAVNSVGVFYSKDNGLTWTLPNSNFTGTSDVLIATNGTIVSDWGNSNYGISYWSPNSFSDGSGLGVQCFALNGTDIYAGTTKGVYISNDKGSSWSPLNGNLPQGLSIHSLIVNGNTIFAGAQYNTVYRSTDGGISWTNVSSGLPVVSGLPLADEYRYIQSIATIGNTVFAGTYGFGVFKSIDNGATWSSASTGMESVKISSIAVKGNDLIALATPHWNTLYRSSDLGLTWSLMSTVGLELVNNITPCDDNIILNKVYGDYFISKDAGATWSSVTGLVDVPEAQIFIIASNESMLLASDFNNSHSGSAYLSTDCGSTWKKLSVPSLTNGGIIIGNSLVISTATGVFKSDDNGDSWTKQSTGLTNQSEHIRFMVLEGDKIIAATWSGQIFSTNSSSFNWSEVKSNLPKGLGAYLENFIVYDKTLIVTLKGIGIYSSVDDGVTWVDQNSGHPSNIEITDLLILNGNLMLVDQAGSIYKSEVKF